ncbi:MAG: ketol-acid reductoisomerase [Phycisphaerales bacterium]|jgi:ketol-acid reductoisomerase|nr:ketol-acid reductoisomerase [Phycisphaerales bacterium]
MAAGPTVILRGPSQVPIDGLLDCRVAILGYGNQGRAHALNLRDSGIDVIVGARHHGAAEQDGFPVCAIAEATQAADLVIMALPDEVHGEVYRELVAPSLRNGTVLGFIHGFSVRFGYIEPPDSVGLVMVAPKGPGSLVRTRFVEGSGVPALMAIEREAPLSRAMALGWAAGIGAGRTGVIETTFGNEAETDLFGEQAIICGGLAALVRAAFETLVSAGYPSELAYIECCHEVKQVADILHERGMAGMMEAISNTAEHGAYEAMDRIDDDHLRSHLSAMLAEVQDGSFARRFVEEGRANLDERRGVLASHDLDTIGEGIRSLWRPPAD